MAFATFDSFMLQARGQLLPDGNASYVGEFVQVPSVANWLQCGNYTQASVIDKGEAKFMLRHVSACVFLIGLQFPITYHAENACWNWMCKLALNVYCQNCELWGPLVKTCIFFFRTSDRARQHYFHLARSRCQFHQIFTHSFYAHADPKSAKRYIDA